MGHQHPAGRRRVASGLGKAAAGAAIYAAKCVACHGAEGAGQPNDRLVGGQGTLTELVQVRTVGSYWPYASTVFDYIRRAMPFQAPQSLTNDEVYALTAYLLERNGIIKARDEMNARTLARVRMPNRDGSFWPTRSARTGSGERTPTGRRAERSYSRLRSSVSPSPIVSSAKSTRSSGRTNR